MGKELQLLNLFWSVRSKFISLAQLLWQNPIIKRIWRNKAETSLAIWMTENVWPIPLHLSLYGTGLVEDVRFFVVVVLFSFWEPWRNYLVNTSRRTKTSMKQHIFIWTTYFHSRILTQWMLLILGFLAIPLVSLGKFKQMSTELAFRKVL